MKIGIFGDVHWSQYSSIVRSRGSKFSTRLENLIDSMNWAERTFETSGCELVIGVGDFMDRADLSSEEITALKEIKWSCAFDHIFLCGNHEMGAMSGESHYNSADMFTNVVTIPEMRNIADFELCLLPYQLETTRKTISEYFGKKTSKRRIIISHNDIKGIQYGGFLSNMGFELSDIESNCDLCINGHLHNGSVITNKIINIGNLSGQNFSEDASKYSHNIFILDTDTLQINAFENPFAFNFYKLDATCDKVNLNSLKNNSVITLKCTSDDADAYRKLISEQENILESRIIIDYSLNKSELDDSTVSIQALSVDHLGEFKKFILSTIGSSDIVLEELDEVCK